MERDESTTVDDLDRADGNSLQENYKHHDVGEGEARWRLEEAGYTVEAWGIDMRDDGGDGVIFDDKMDLKIFDGDELVGLMDVKTKSGPSYMGRFNERHYTHYFRHAQEHEVPVFVAMFQVDYESDTVHDEFVFEIDGTEHGEGVHLSSESDAVSPFPDGNTAVLVKHFHRQPWHVVEERLAESAGIE